MRTTSSVDANPRSTPLLVHQRRVRMIDTDAAQLIYFGAVFTWAEALFTDWLASVDRPLSRNFEEGIGLPVVHSEADYLHPLGLDDDLDLELWTNHVGERSFSLETVGYLLPGRKESIRVRVWHAFVEFQPREGTTTPKLGVAALPRWLREALR